MALSQSCSYDIDNTTSCALTCTIIWYDNSAPSCPPCYSLTGVTVPTNSFVTVTCSGCSGLCNVSVQVTAPFIGPVMDINNQTVTSVTAGGCTPNGLCDMNWQGSVTDIHQQ